MYTKAGWASWISAAALALGHATMATAYSANDIIATYAGNGTVGYSGDAGPAVSAMLNTPAQIAVDSAGNLYISDSGNGTIRKVSTAGIITTIAGTGTPGYNGDNIPATMAQVFPRGLAFDAAGDLYIADAGNNRIRKITFSTGVISTVAGSGASGCSNDTANLAIFSNPVGLAFDSAGTLYISESGNHIVRKLSGGQVTSFAGTCSQPAFTFPDGLITDAAGNVYVVAQDETSNYVWKYDSNGNRTVFAGDGANGNTGDGSAANSAGVTIADPHGIARDAAGNIFISSGDVVRVVTPDGIIHTAAGNGTSGHSGDGGLATGAELSNIYGVAVNASGRLFISDISTAPTVHIVGPAAPVIVKTAGNGQNSEDIVSADGRIACSACGANYVQGMPVILTGISSPADSLYEWSGACRGAANPCTVIALAGTNTAVAHFTPWYIQTVAGRGTTSTQLMTPLGLAIAPSGNLYISDTGDCVVRMLSSGTLTTVAGNGICGDIGDGMAATDAELRFPEGLALDSHGNLYIQDGGNAKLRKVTTDGILHTLSTNIVETEAPGLAIDMTDTAYVIGANNTIIEVQPNGTTSTFATVDTIIGELKGLTLENSGELIAGLGNFDSDAADFYAVTSPDFSKWVSVGSGARGSTTSNYGFASIDRSTIYYVRNCGIFVTPFYQIASETCSGYSDEAQLAITAGLLGPGGIVVANRTRLYVADSYNNAVRAIYADAIFTHGFEQ